MSMNLMFIAAGEQVDFPYQTSTELTFEVLACASVHQQLQLIREDVESKGWGVEEAREMVRRVEDMMTNPELELDMI